MDDLIPAAVLAAWVVAMALWSAHLYRSEKLRTPPPSTPQEV